MTKFTCPRRVEDVRHSGPNLDEWRKDDTCNYCGSVKPELLFSAIEQGYELGSTDKSYKVYVDLPGSGKMKVIGHSNSPQAGWKKTPFKQEWKLKQRETKRHAKFYFQHFSEADQKKFIELVNSKAIKWAGGFSLYVLPFFMRKADK